MRKESGQKIQKEDSIHCVMCQMDRLGATHKSNTFECLKSINGKLGRWRHRDENCPNKMMAENQELKPVEREAEGNRDKILFYKQGKKGRVLAEAEGRIVGKGEKEVSLQSLVLRNHNQRYNEMFQHLGKSLRSFIQGFSCCVQINKHHLGGSVLHICISCDGAGQSRTQGRDLPCHTLIVSNSGSVAIGVYGGECFTPGNKCNVCLGMSINKLSALIGIDLFIHYNTVQ